MVLNFYTKLFTGLILVFILMTVIGTLSHEMGHYFAAKLMGFNARINYGTTFIQDNFGRKMSRDEAFLFMLGGPLQTMLTGTLGITLLFVYRNSFQNRERLTLRQWILIFTSLFWLRQVSNLFTWTLNYLINGKFGKRGDEIKLARYLELPKGAILLATAIIGIAVVLVIIFKFIPKNIRLTFIASGIVGGVLGYILWLKMVGKILMP